jgi:hypothetical protein
MWCPSWSIVLFPIWTGPQLYPTHLPKRTQPKLHRLDLRIIRRPDRVGNSLSRFDLLCQQPVIFLVADSAAEIFNLFVTSPSALGYRKAVMSSFLHAGSELAFPSSISAPAVLD